MEDLYQRCSCLVTVIKGSDLNGDEIMEELFSVVSDKSTICGLGQLRKKYEWCLTLKTPKDVEDLVAKEKTTNLTFSSALTKYVIGKLLWLPIQLPDQKFKERLMRFGKLIAFEQEVHTLGGISVYSGIRRFKLELNDGIKKEEVPHVIEINGQLGLVSIVGRAPQCHVCRVVGHIAKHCLNREPRKDQEDSRSGPSTTKSYAGVTKNQPPVPTTIPEVPTPIPVKPAPKKKTPAPRKKRAPARKKGGKSAPPPPIVKEVPEKENPKAEVPEEMEATEASDRPFAKRSRDSDDEEKLSAKERCKKQMQAMLDLANNEFDNVEVVPEKVILEDPRTSLQAQRNLTNNLLRSIQKEIIPKIAESVEQDCSESEAEADNMDSEYDTEFELSDDED